MFKFVHTAAFSLSEVYLFV